MVGGGPHRHAVECVLLERSFKRFVSIPLELPHCDESQGAPRGERLHRICDSAELLALQQLCQLGEDDRHGHVHSGLKSVVRRESVADASDLVVVAKQHLGIRGGKERGPHARPCKWYLALW